METVAERLISTRREKGYTQEQLAKFSQVSVSSIRRYEQGANQNKEPSAYNLLVISQVLDVTPEYLLLGENKMNTYTTAIKIELSQINNFSVIKAIKEMKLNEIVLSHLELGEALVNEVRNAWMQHKLFTIDDEKHYCTRNFVREVIIRYCQNRTSLKKKYNIADGMQIPRDKRE